ncbi:hypothetical protein QR680_004881 [Steinernema hermaphroditum]|uniref:Uncharacterized protein n=1 Tax=Steinernema hermaphroditum TaxID=289476 RepID=A0AA39HQ51_9BILA|nr:hypothetical protein QR680_004881 [Steinernema hermaphroditum]
MMSVGQLFVGVVYTSISSVSLCLYVIVLYVNLQIPFFSIQVKRLPHHDPSGYRRLPPKRLPPLKYYPKRAQSAFKIALAASWVFISLFFIAYMSPFCSLIYDLKHFAWDYDHSSWSDTVSWIDLYKEAEPAADRTENPRAGHHHKRVHVALSRREAHLQVLSAQHEVDALNTINVVNSSINPVLYLTLNPKLRRIFMRLVLCKIAPLKKMKAIRIKVAS